MDPHFTKQTPLQHIFDLKQNAGVGRQNSKAFPHIYVHQITLDESKKINA
jgi:hypothetical protein